MIVNLQNYCNKRNSDGNFSRHHRFFAPYFLILEAKRIFLARTDYFHTVGEKDLFLQNFFLPFIPHFAQFLGKKELFRPLSVPTWK